jgi:geranylgeranyl diphosphate synthase type I
MRTTSTTSKDSPSGFTRTADQVLTEARALEEPGHRAAVDRMPGLMRHIAGYHSGWWDADGRASGPGGGKSIRPALVLAAATAVGGSRARALDEAVAVELVHDSSLLHDDVIDGDLTRRHRPTAWSLYGVSAAVLAGDLLLTLAYDLLAGRPGLKVLTTAVIELCAGQAADLALGERTDVGVEECTAMAVAKTSALLACACELGALAGGGGERQRQLLAEFGRHLGLAFQLVDDLLGIWGDPAVTGKPAYNDLASRKKSLPVVAALNSGTPAGDHLARLYGLDHDGDHDFLNHMAALVDAAGGRAWAQQEADKRMRTALDCLAQAVPDSSASGDLVALARLIVRRDH